MSPSAVGHDPRRSRGQAHQNKYAFKHNKNSKKTQKIEETVNVGGLCERCAEKIEWRKKVRRNERCVRSRPLRERLFPPGVNDVCVTLTAVGLSRCAHHSSPCVSLCVVNRNSG